MEPTEALRTLVRDVAVSDAERRRGALSSHHLRLAELLLAYRGYVILEDGLDRALVDRLRRAFESIYEECTGDAPSNGEKIWPPRISPSSRAHYHVTNGRWRIQPRLVAPMNDVALLANPLVISILHARLGRDIHCRYASSDTCAPGALLQAPHSDIDTTALRERRRPCGYVVNVPLVECGLHNGPLEVWPGGSHLWTWDLLRQRGVRDVMIQDSRNEPMEALAAHLASVKLTLRPGDILVRDPAMWHRGTPNPSAEPRTMLTLGYFRDDYFYIFGDTSHDEAAFEGMDPSVQRLFAYRFNPGSTLFWKARRCPWPGGTQLSVRDAAAAWARWRLRSLALTGRAAA